MEQYVHWIIENKEWIFSGVGVILFSVLGVLAKFYFSENRIVF